MIISCLFDLESKRDSKSKRIFIYGKGLIFIFKLNEIRSMGKFYTHFCCVFQVVFRIIGIWHLNFNQTDIMFTKRRRRRGDGRVHVDEGGLGT